MAWPRVFSDDHPKTKQVGGELHFDDYFRECSMCRRPSKSSPLRVASASFYPETALCITAKTCKVMTCNDL